jgi:LmbE family N-acetylglucosaminyl deacetylase
VTAENDPVGLGTILGVWAHPDDEAYLSGALMAAAVEAGHRVVCITATRGEAGSLDEERWPPATLADVRERELDACLQALGVTEHRWLGFPDGGCDDVPDAEAVESLAETFADTDPDTVLTFGPDGMTGHADHIAVGRWATEAFQRWAAPRARLLYATKTREWVDDFMSTVDPDRVMMGADEPPATDAADLAFHLAADGELLERKVAALKCQESQVEGLLRDFGEESFRRLMRDEFFRLP